MIASKIKKIENEKFLTEVKPIDKLMKNISSIKNICQFFEKCRFGSL